MQYSHTSETHLYANITKTITVTSSKAMDSSLLTKISSGKNLKFTVHLNMKTRPRSKEPFKYW